MNEPAPIMEVKMMTREEAQKRVAAINSQMNNIRALILDFHDREGWKALGYDSWTACVESEFEVGRRQIFYQLKAAQIEQNINDSLKSQCNNCTDPIPETQLRPLAALPPEDQAPAYQLAQETAPEGKVTARHVEKVVREIRKDSTKTYRIRDIATGEWWEGEARTAEAACELARGNSLGSSKAKWKIDGCDIKEKTDNGAGGWRKVKAGEEKAAKQAKVPAREKGGPSSAFYIPPLVGRENPADLVQKIINLIDTITDDNPRCKEALRKIAVHVWNRQHHKQEEGK